MKSISKGRTEQEDRYTFKINEIMGDLTNGNSKSIFYKYAYDL